MTTRGINPGGRPKELLAAASFSAGAAILASGEFSLVLCKGIAVCLEFSVSTTLAAYSRLSVACFWPKVGRLRLFYFLLSSNSVDFFLPFDYFTVSFAFLAVSSAAACY